MSNPNVTVDRDKFIGGSDCPSILGLNAKYGKTIYDFAREKLGIIANSFKGNQFTHYGNLLEPIVRDYMNSVYQANYMEDTLIDTTRMLRGNVDGIDRNAEIPILEIKTFGEELDVAYYTPQCQFYMEVYNQPRCLLVGYKRPEDFYTGMDYDLEHDDSYFNIDFDPNRVVTHVIERDPKMWAKMEARINVFKNALKELKLNNDMTETDFNKLFYGNDLVVMANKLAVLETMLNGYKDMEKEYKKLKEDLYKVFDEKDVVSFDTGTIKFTKVAPTSYDKIEIDAAKLKNNLPEIYEEYKVTKTTNKKGYILITSKKGG